METRGMEHKVGCIIMASGLSKRFGENKLLVDFHGQLLIEHMLKLTDGDMFCRRIVVTRTEEAASLCRKRGVEVILHDCPGRGDAVRLGMEEMTAGNSNLDGCMFIPCDQPLLQKNSLARMISVFSEKKKRIVQLGSGENRGAPVLFSADYFLELKELPSGKGGSYIMRKYPEQITVVQADYDCELFDMDTREDYEKLLGLYLTIDIREGVP